MKSSSYLSSARTLSVLMLLAVYLDIDLTRGQLERNGWLNEARQVYAAAYVEGAGQQPSMPQIDVPGVGQISAKKEMVRPNYESWAVRVKRVDGRQWRAVVDGRDSSSLRVQRLQRIAAALGLKDPDKIDGNVPALFRAIERDSTERKVTVPGVDLAFRPDIAPWIIALFTLGFLLLMRNQLGRVLMDEDLAMDEPWIVVDGGRGLERLVAAGWLIAIWAAPWVASGCLLAVFSSQIIVDGAVTTLPRELLACGASLVLVVLGGWASLTTTSDLLRLRRLRQVRLERVRAGDSG